MIENTTAPAGLPDIEQDPAFAKCVAFLASLGICISYQPLPDGTFLPGISIEAGKIIIDNSKFLFPGDILHEAAHIAVVPAADRDTLDASSIAQRPHSEAEEMMAIAWSYAACVHLELDPYFVFHDKGYKGGGTYIADNFKEKRYFGLPMLQWKGMALDEQQAARQNSQPYPHMLKWMLD